MAFLMPYVQVGIKETKKKKKKKISKSYLKIEEGNDLNSDRSPTYLTVSREIAKKVSIVNTLQQAYIH